MTTAGSHPSTSTHSTGVEANHSLRSMTGYAEARTLAQGWNVRITIRAVNHRFLDLHLRLPEGFEPLEPKIRQSVRQSVRRGHLDVTLYYEPAGQAAVGVNAELAAAYVQAANSLREKFGIRTEPDLAAILRLPGVIGAAALTREQDFSRLESVVIGCLDESLAKLNRMRGLEGSHLHQEMSGRLRNISALAARVTALAERAQPAFAKRLEFRLQALLGEAQIDPTRLAQEAAIAAERSDVSEELARLRSHVQQFDALLAGAPDVGKKLDFLLQEMQREANTLLSKSPGTEAEGIEITQIGLEIKSEIEKLREQVQNIE
ncbi:MAG: YicC/YloC family endoribonuclease [Candidatus Acidiferrales bacterium]